MKKSILALSMGLVFAADVHAATPEERIGAAEGRIGSAEGRIGAAETRIRDSEGRIGAAETRIGAAEQRIGDAVTGLGATVSNLQTTVEGIDTRVGNIHNTLNSVRTIVIDELRPAVAGINDQLDEIQTNGIQTENGTFSADDGLNSAWLNNGGVGVTAEGNATYLEAEGLTTSGFINVGGFATLNGGAEINNGATINGDTALNGNVGVTGTFTTDGAATLNGGAIINNDATVNGTTNLNGNVNVSGNTNLNDVTLNGTLTSSSTSGPDRSLAIDSGVLTTTGPNGGSVVVKGNNVTASNAAGTKTTSLDSNGVTTSSAAGTTTVSGGSLSIQAVAPNPNERTAGATTAFSIKTIRQSNDPDGGMSPFALPIEEDVFKVDIDGNVQTEGNIDAAGSITAQAMVVDGVDVGSTLNRLDSRLNHVEKTAYRGIAIALAAQQNVPNIKPGQYALFGGVGFYEGESAGAFGLVGSVSERTSISAALGVAGGSEVGGRVGVAYVFGGN